MAKDIYLYIPKDQQTLNKINLKRIVPNQRGEENLKSSQIRTLYLLGMIIPIMVDMTSETIKNRQQWENIFKV